MKHTISVSTPRSVTRDCSRKGKQVYPALARHWNRYGLALLLLVSASCSPGGRQQESAARGKNDPPSQSSSIGQALKPVPFAEFTVKVHVEDKRFMVNGDFTLGSGSNGINLSKDDVNLRVGTSSVVIPPASFEQNEKGKLKYKTEVDGLAWTVVIRDQGNGNFSFRSVGERAEPFGEIKPTDVVLAIGDDSGSAKPASE